MTGGILGSGIEGYAALAAAGFLMTQPWRWLGILLGRGLDVEGDVFLWCRAVSTAIVAALIGRIIAFPSGALAEIQTPVRIAAFVAGIALYLAFKRSLVAGVIAALAVLVTGAMLSPG
jgi:branched-subunit amino acid transport protein